MKCASRWRSTVNIPPCQLRFVRGSRIRQLRVVVVIVVAVVVMRLQTVRIIIDRVRFREPVADCVRLWQMCAQVS